MMTQRVTPTLMGLMAAGLTCAMVCASNASAETGFLDRQVIIRGEAYRYQVYVPAEFTSTRKWPVVLFLNGSGERGADGLRQTDNGLATVIRQDRTAYPAVCVFPQARSNARWSAPEMEDMALAALDASVKEFSGDPDRLFLTGWAMGGQGVLRIASRWPARFAALVDISGTVPALSPPATEQDVAVDVRTHAFLSEPDVYAALAKLIGKTPIWIFHGEFDNNVPVDQSQRLVAALKSAGADVRYTEYGGGGHAISEYAFQEAALKRWLFSQSLKRASSSQRP